MDWSGKERNQLCSDRNARPRLPGSTSKYNASSKPESRNPLPQRRLLQRSASLIELTGSGDDNEDDTRTSERQNDVLTLIDLTGSDGGIVKSHWQKHKSVIHVVGDDSSIQTAAQSHFRADDEPIPFMDAQEIVLQVAVDGHNIFLNGAAGSSKRATLEEILRLIRAVCKSLRQLVLPHSPLTVELYIHSQVAK